MLKEGSHFICLPVVSTDAVFEMGKDYYPQVFLEECKYFDKEEEATIHIIEALKLSSDDSDESDEE